MEHICFEQRMHGEEREKGWGRRKKSATLALPGYHVSENVHVGDTKPPCLGQGGVKCAVSLVGGSNSDGLRVQS